jgi:hypothetical protein
MSAELILNFYPHGEVATGPGSIDTGVYSAPAITYSASKFYMTLSPITYGDVEYNEDAIGLTANPTAYFTKDGGLGASNLVTISADNTEITSAIGTGVDDVHAVLLTVYQSGASYKITVYVKDSDITTMAAGLVYLRDNGSLTVDAIIESVFTPPASPPNDYTYDVTALYVYTLQGCYVLASPTLIAYKNDVAMTLTTDYTIIEGESVIGGPEIYRTKIKVVAAPVAGDVITATYKWGHECVAAENVNVYEFDKESNVSVQKDVNGYTMLTEAYSKFTGFRGVMTWPYATYQWYEELRQFAERKGSYIDVIRVSLSGTACAELTNLYISNFPKWSEEPGVVGYMKEITFTLIG